jgi:hypothetical protein
MVQGTDPNQENNKHSLRIIRFFSMVPWGLMVDHKWKCHISLIPSWLNWVWSLTVYDEESSDIKVSTGKMKHKVHNNLAEECAHTSNNKETNLYHAWFVMPMMWIHQLNTPPSNTGHWAMLY